MRQRFDQNYAQKFQVDKKEYAQQLNQQIRLKAERNNENKILDQALDYNLIQMPRSRYQITSLYYDNEMAKMQKMQQQMMEQDIFNYNRMVAEQKKLQRKQQKELEEKEKLEWEAKQQKNNLKLPRILVNSQEHNNGKQSQNSKQQNLSKSYVQSQSPALGSSQLTQNYSYDAYDEDRQISPSKDPEKVDQNEVEQLEQKQAQETKARNQNLEAIRRKMHENYISTKNQIFSLLEFIKYNQQQKSQYEQLTKQLDSFMKQKKPEPSYPYLRQELKKKMENDQIFHFNEFQEQLNEEIKNSSNYVNFEKNNKEKTMSEKQEQIYLDI